MGLSDIPSPPRLPEAIVAAIRAGKYFGIQAGDGSHRFMAIWVVEQNGRVFARSWTMKPNGWHRTMVEEGRGRLRAGEREIPVRAKLVRSERIKDAVTKAYFAKYDTPGSLMYCRGFARGRRRDSTIEFLPASSRAARR